MAEIYGMDIDAVGELSRRMKTAADRLVSIRAEVDSALQHSHWEGLDANDFRNRWLFGWSGTLLNAADALAACSGALGDNVTQQIDASTNTTPLSTLLFDGLVRTPAEVLGHVDDGLDLVERAAEDKAHYVPDVVTKDATWLDHQMPDLLKLHDAAGPVLSGVGILLSGADLIHGLATDPGSDGTWNAGADTLLAVGGAIALAAAPASLAVAAGVFAVQGTYEVVEHFDPHVSEQIAHTTSVAAKDAWHGMQDVGGAIGHGSADLVKGGYSLISKFL